MDSIISFFQRITADPIVMIYWFLGGYFLGLWGGSKIERTKWKTKLAYGLDCPYCGEPFKQCEHLRCEYKQRKDDWVEKILNWISREIFGREREDVE